MKPMKKANMKVLVLLLLAQVLTSCGASSSPLVVEEEGFGEFISGRTYNGRAYLGIWNKTVLPVKLRISNSFSVAEVDATTRASDSWNAASSTGVQFFDMNSAAVNNIDGRNAGAYPNDNIMGLYKSSTWLEGYSSSVVAITQFVVINRGSYNEMIHADIILNDRDFNFKVGANGDTGFMDFESVILHEMGHFAGLDHQTDRNTLAILQTTLGRGQEKQVLFADDHEGVDALYGGVIALVEALNIEDTDTFSTVPQLGVAELNVDGTCKHYLDGEFKESHHVNLK